MSEELDLSLLVTIARAVDDDLTVGANELAKMVSEKNQHFVEDLLNGVASAKANAIRIMAGVDPVHTDNVRDYPEDFSMRDGEYYHECSICNSSFSGHKRRRICKVCDRQSKEITTEVVSLGYSEAADILESWAADPSPFRSDISPVSINESVRLAIHALRSM